MSKVRDKQIFESKMIKTSAYIYHSSFISREDKRKVQWFTVRVIDNKTNRSFQQHEVHIPQNVNKKDLQTIKESVIEYITSSQSVYEKY